jgi:hypothetical protein
VKLGPQDRFTGQAKKGKHEKGEGRFSRLQDFVLYFLFSSLLFQPCFEQVILPRDLLTLIGMPKEDLIVAPIIIGYPRAIRDVPDRMDPQVLKIVP